MLSMLAAQVRNRNMQWHQAASIHNSSSKQAHAALSLTTNAACTATCVTQAGAKHVYAVDASPGAAELARKVIAANGLSGRISVITGRAEAVALPLRPNSVDVVLSSWMGSMLLHEGLLPALMRVRDRYVMRWAAPRARHAHADAYAYAPGHKRRTLVPLRPVQVARTARSDPA